MMFSGIVAVLDVPRMLLTVKNMAQGFGFFSEFPANFRLIGDSRFKG